MSIISTIKSFENHKNHAPDNDTDAKPSKQKSSKYFNKIALKYQRMLLVASGSGETKLDMIN